MKAIIINPGQKASARLAEVPTPFPNPDEVLVKVLQAGFCRTDQEIYQGFYGQAPEGLDYLIMGHESLGRVTSIGKEVGNGLQEGDLVVRTVRRPCLDLCLNCRDGENDMCLTGNYLETGIVGLQGVMAEYYVEKPDYLVLVPSELKSVGVLMEPLSFCEKTVYRACEVQKRMNHWSPGKALVFGAGPIGILTTLLLRNCGIEVYTVGSSPKGNLKSQLVEECGAIYLSAEQNDLNKMAGTKFGFVVEASGRASNACLGLKYLGNNGIMALTSITGEEELTEISLGRINLSLVLGNKIVMGVVNANVKDYYRGLHHLDDFERKWSGLVPRLITSRLTLDNYQQGFEKKREEIKTVLEFSE